MVNFMEVKYCLSAFRTKKTYLLYLIAQLALAVAIVPIALMSPNHFRSSSVLILEFVLFLLFTFDLLVVRLISEGGLCGSKSNIFDFGLLCLFAATLIFLVTYGQGNRKDYRELLQTDDVIILAIVMSRYVMQVISLVRVIRKAKVNRALYDEFKKVDLNAGETVQNNQTLNFNDMNKADEMVRDKITKHTFQEEEA